jgi:hypothetical protein
LFLNNESTSPQSSVALVSSLLLFPRFIASYLLHCHSRLSDVLQYRWSLIKLNSGPLSACKELA